MKKYLKNFLINFGALLLFLSIISIVITFFYYFFVEPGCSAGVPGIQITSSLVPCGWKSPFMDFLSRQIIFLVPLILSFGIYKLGKKI